MPEQETGVPLTQPDLKVAATTYAEYCERADELGRKGFQFDRNVPLAERDTHIASFHRDPQVNQVAESPAFTRPNTTLGETEGKLLPDLVGIWYSTKE